MKIKRSIYNELRREIAEPQILVLTGSRQVGKTTLMRQLEFDCLERGMRTRFLDLEQPDDLAALRGEREDLIRSLVHEVDVVFIDEF